jgi:hypothetical protein
MRFFNCFQKKKEEVVVENPLQKTSSTLPDNLSELLYLETVVYMNLNSFNREADALSEKASIFIHRGDMYRGMFILRQRRALIEETGKLVEFLQELKAKKKYLEEFPAEFRAAKKIKF